MRLSSSFRRYSPVLFLLVFAAAGSWWIIVRADGQMRERMIQQVRMASYPLDSGLVGSLTGTRADVSSPVYAALKKQLAGCKNANKKYRFAYLLGRKDDGALFFFADNEPAGSPDESPPGQVYTEADPRFQLPFDTGNASVVGPVSDRWGSWVSALIPLVDRQSGRVVAVFGMDIDAGAWNWEVAANSALSLSLFLIVIILLSVRWVLPVLSVDSLALPLHRKLLFPLVSVILTLFLGFGILIALSEKYRMNELSHHILENASNDLFQALDAQSRALTAVQEILARVPSLREVLKSRDRQRMLAAYAPIFEELKATDELSHFYLYDSKRTCMLRLHRPDFFGDRIERATLKKAESTGALVSGLEIGSFGNLAIRTVQPVYEDGLLIGYLEMGKDIRDIADDVKFLPDVAMVLTVRKEFLERASWEAEMRRKGNVPLWEELPSDVVLVSTTSLPAGEFVRLAGRAESPHSLVKQARLKGSPWHMLSVPVNDAAGRIVGDLLVLHDLAAHQAEYKRLIAILAGSGTVFLAGLFAFLFVLLKSIDGGMRAQQARLRESEESHRLLIEHALSGIAVHRIVLDPAGKPVDYVFLDANPAFETHTGLRVSDILNRRVTEVIPDIAESGLIDIYGRVVISGESVSFERYIESLGRHFSISAYRISAEKFATVFTDITQRKKAEKELQQVRFFLEKVLNSVADPIFVKDAGHRWLAVNDAFCRFLGHSREEIIGKSDYDFFPREEADVFWKKDDAVFETGKMDVNEEQFTDSSGVLHYISTKKSLFILPESSEKILVGVIRDITGYKQLERALRESEAALMAAQAIARIGSWKYDPASRRFTWSDEMFRIIGRDPEKGISSWEDFREHIHPEDWQRVDAMVRGAVRDGRPFRDIFRVVRSDGSVIWAEVICQVQPSESGGAAVTFSGTFQDVTERKLAEESLNCSLSESLKSREIMLSMLEDNSRITDELKAKLEELKQAQAMLVQSEKMASLGKLVADMAHEVNNPLMIISGNAQLSMLDNSLSAEVRGNLQIIYEECNRAKSIIQRLLMFSRPSKGEQRPIDVNRAVDAVVSLLGHQFSLSNIRIVQNLAAGLLEVVGDEKQFQEVFMNLLNNARDAMPAGGTIEIVTAFENGQVKIEFSDTGHGMDEKTLSRVFEPFFTTKEKGTGLGLAVCYGIIKSHKGTIEVRSEIGRGTTVEIRLPGLAKTLS